MNLLQSKVLENPTGRSSSITNAYVNSIIPIVYPIGAEVIEILAVLGMSPVNQIL
jgi:hypothetical protein